MKAVWAAVLLGTTCLPVCLPIQAQPLRFHAAPSASPASNEARRFVASGEGFDLRLAANAAVIDVANATPTPARLRMSIRGADAHAPAVTLQPLPATTASDDGPSYGYVAYHDIYPGIDVSYRSHAGQLDYDFTVEPEADPGRIAFSFPGSDAVLVDPQSGDLVVRLAGTDMHQARPVIYQDSVDGRVPVEGGYRLTDDDRVVFTIGAYDRHRALIIDPTVTFVASARRRDNRPAVAGQRPLEILAL
jgi:hypothetical protein